MSFKPYVSRAMMAVLFVAALLVLPVAGAQTVIFTTVNCDESGVAQYDSINAALSSADWTYPLDIEVTGTCQERVTIGDGGVFARNSVNIHAAAGLRATLTPPLAGQGKGTVLTIGAGRGIWIERLDISGGAKGVMLHDGSEVDFANVTIENNSNMGVDIQGKSIAFFDNSRIRHNTMVGVNINTIGSNTVFFNGRVGAETAIEDNGQLGINAGSLANVSFNGANFVRNNGGGSTPMVFHGGIRAARNSVVQAQASNGSQTNGATEITANVGPGIIAEVNSSVMLQGASIHGNSEQGVRARSHSVVELLPPSILGANSIDLITCDAWSMVTGDFTGAAVVDCKNIDDPNKTKK